MKKSVFYKQVKNKSRELPKFVSDNPDLVLAGQLAIADLMLIIGTICMRNPDDELTIDHVVPIIDFIENERSTLDIYQGYPITKFFETVFQLILEEICGQQDNTYEVVQPSVSNPKTEFSNQEKQNAIKEDIKKRLLKIIPFIKTPEDFLDVLELLTFEGRKELFHFMRKDKVAHHVNGLLENDFKEMEERIERLFVLLPKDTYLCTLHLPIIEQICGNFGKSITEDLHLVTLLSVTDTNCHAKILLELADRLPTLLQKGSGLVRVLNNLNLSEFACLFRQFKSHLKGMEWDEESLTNLFSVTCKLDKNKILPLQRIIFEELGEKIIKLVESGRNMLNIRHRCMDDGMFIKQLGHALPNVTKTGIQLHYHLCKTSKENTRILFSTFGYRKILSLLSSVTPLSVTPSNVALIGANITPFDILRTVISKFLIIYDPTSASAPDKAFLEELLKKIASTEQLLLILHDATEYGALDFSRKNEIIMRLGKSIIPHVQHYDQCFYVLEKLDEVGKQKLLKILLDQVPIDYGYKAMEEFFTSIIPSTNESAKSLSCIGAVTSFVTLKWLIQEYSWLGYPDTTQGKIFFTALLSSIKTFSQLYEILRLDIGNMLKKNIIESLGQQAICQLIKSDGQRLLINQTLDKEEKYGQQQLTELLMKINHHGKWIWHWDFVETPKLQTKALNNNKLEMDTSDAELDDDDYIYYEDDDSENEKDSTHTGKRKTDDVDYDPAEGSSGDSTDAEDRDDDNDDKQYTDKKRSFGPRPR